MALALLSIALSLAGSAVVRDRSGQVASAVVTDGLRTQPLWRLPGGLFVAIPRIEGTIEVRCRDGTSHQQGYVTGHMHTWVVVEGPECDRPVEV